MTLLSRHVPVWVIWGTDLFCGIGPRPNLDVAIVTVEGEMSHIESTDNFQSLLGDPCYKSVAVYYRQMGAWGPVAVRGTVQQKDNGVKFVQYSPGITRSIFSNM